ncbi:MAG: hypothetical protein HOP12_08345 [Candidatus Eisenbacteria bacterium]|uniref:LTD domain-containing protein n=1 Tax=Eiseniibacteriota bacterium TaxID=2212470 RepID=A0A849SFN0_UNCEI|nr:hypothetical protein [Candidatus Eisenbacteria bacterium]
MRIPNRWVRRAARELGTLTVYSVGAALLMLASLAISMAEAGQVRVTVSGTSFSPPNVNVNPGDHVVWVWAGGNHNVLSGNSCTPSAGFTSGTATSAVNTAFTWRSSGVVSRSYFCEVHCSGFGMVGSVGLSMAAVPVSDFRLTEVRFSDDHTNDFVEIANLGAATGNLGRYRLSLTGATVQTLPQTDISVPPGGRVVVFLNQTGTNTNTSVFFQGVTLPRTGSATLYVATTNASQTALNRDDMLLDFVQWGAATQQNESTAANAGFWNIGEFVDAVADGHSLAFCGSATEHGATTWQGIATPNPGTADCSTPTRNATWGRLKLRYR